jgi:ADP-ribose pyrophosphatase
MSFPTHAKKVFTGVIFDVYQWDQKMYDGTTKTYEGLGRDHAVQVIAVNDDILYIAKQEQPHIDHAFYSLFGGRIDPGEVPLAAAQRELEEESGLTSDNWTLHKSVTPYSKMDFITYIYIAKNCIFTNKQNLDGGEKIDIIECGVDEFVKLAVRDDFFSREIQLDILRELVIDSTLSKFRKLIK